MDVADSCPMDPVILTRLAASEAGSKSNPSNAVHEPRTVYRTTPSSNDGSSIASRLSKALEESDTHSRTSKGTRLSRCGLECGASSLPQFPLPELSVPSPKSRRSSVDYHPRTHHLPRTFYKPPHTIENVTNFIIKFNS